MSQNGIKAIPISTFNSAGLQLLNWLPITPAGGLPNACFMLRIRNFSNRAVLISYDGVNIHDISPADSEMELPFQQNAQPNNQRAYMKKGTNVYLIGNPVGAVGFIFLSGYYQEHQ